MPKLTMAWRNHAVWSCPKRGDVLCFPKTRYWVLRVRKVKTRDGSAKYSCWCEREEYVDEALRLRLVQSARRDRGQLEHECFWHSRSEKVSA